MPGSPVWRRVGEKREKERKGEGRIITEFAGKMKKIRCRTCQRKKRGRKEKRV